MMTSNAVVSEGVVVREPFLRETPKVSWGSILAGLVVALGAWVLLSVLGLAIGLSAVDPSEPASLKSAGLVSGIWSLIVPFVALLVGGIVAAKTAGAVSRPTGAIHGLVLWALATIASLVLVGYVVRGVAGAALTAGSGVAAATSSIVPEATTPGGVLQSLGIGSEDLLAPVNEKLRDEGKPPVTTAELDATLKEVARTGVRQGRIDRDTFVSALSRNTNLSLADADEIATRIDMTVSRRGAEARRDLETGAAKAVDTTGKAMWWVFLGMLLGLGSAVVGSTLGVSRKQRMAALTPPTFTTRPATMNP